MPDAIENLFSARMKELGSNPPTDYKEINAARAKVTALIGGGDQLRELESIHYKLAQATARKMYEKGLQDGAALAGVIQR